MDKLKALKLLEEKLYMAYCSGRANNTYIPKEVSPDLLKSIWEIAQQAERERRNDEPTSM